MKAQSKMKTKAAVKAETTTYVIVRSSQAGVHAGILVSYDRATRHAVLRESRRLWQWYAVGKGTLSHLAVLGHRPQCGITGPAVDSVIADVCEVLTCTPVSRASIEALS